MEGKTGGHGLTLKHFLISFHLTLDESRNEPVGNEQSAESCHLLGGGKGSSGIDRADRCSPSLSKATSGVGVGSYEPV